MLSQSPSGLSTNLTNTLSTSLPTTNLLTANPLSTGTAMMGASQATYTYTVTNTNDSGVGSLRAAIAAANGDSAFDPNALEVINFNLTGTGVQTITLGSTLDITAKNLTIKGTGANNLIISGNNQVEDFLIEAGATVTISGLTITQGNSANGGGINNSGTLTLNNDIISHNSAAFGGGIDNQGGTLTVSNSTFSNNTATEFGGGILNQGILTVSNGTFSHNSAAFGGSINNLGSTLTVSNSTFSNNSALAIGGGILNANNAAGVGSTLKLSNSTFSGNQANRGGGIANLSSTEAVNNSTFSGNQASQGGGIYSLNSTVNASGLVFSGNTSTGATGTPTDNNNAYGAINFTSLTVDSLTDTSQGKDSLTSGHITLRDALAAIGSGGTITFAPNLTGTITLTQGELDITKNVTIQGLGANKLTIDGNHQFRDFNIGTGVNVTISGLTITNGNSLGNGGDILNQGKLTLNQDMVENGQAAIGGGIFNDIGATLTVIASTLTGNKLLIPFGDDPNPIGGDGLANLGTATLTNTTIVGNGKTGRGGGIGNGATGSLTLNNDTITGNSGIAGGGVYNLGAVKVHNTIIAKNTATGAGADIFGTFTSLGFNLIGIEDLNATGFTNGQKGDIVGTIAKPIDPKLGTLQNNGGFTFTEALLTGSPAINAGDPNNGNNPTTDQRGISRPQRGRADIGAFELV